MAVPNHFHVVQDVYDQGDYNLKTHDGQAAFVDDVVVALHATDPRWGHLKKNPGQTQIHGHAEDAALYLSDTPGQSQSVDFIAGAGGPNPKPAWGVDIPRYSRSDWYPPDEHPPLEEPEPEPDCPEFPGYEDLGGDAFFRTNVGVPLAADTAEAGQVMNDGSAVWFSRTIHSLIASFFALGNYSDAPAILKKHRNEWRAILGLAPLP